MRKIFHQCLLAVGLSLMPLSSAQALHCQPYWTAAYKCMMGCGGCPSGGVPANDNGAAQRAQEAKAAEEAARQREEELYRARFNAEKARQLEEQIKKQADFENDRDATVNTLHGSADDSAPEGPGQSGLRGSSEETGSGSDASSIAADSILQGSGSYGTSQKKKSTKKDFGGKSPCPPVRDPSVVDLCFLGDKPAVIAPAILKGMKPAEKILLKASTQTLTKNLIPFDSAIYHVLADQMGGNYAETSRPWPGPENPGPRLINPLSDPEKHKAYWDKVDAGLRAHAEAEAKEFKAPAVQNWHEVYDQQLADPKFMQSKDQILKTMDQEESQARQRGLVKFREFLDKQGGTDWPERIKTDELFRARMVMERNVLFQKIDQDTYNARGRAFRQMTALVKDWKAPGPEKPSK